MDERVTLAIAALEKIPGGKDLAAELEAAFNQVASKNGGKLQWNLKDLDKEPDAPASGSTLYSFEGRLKAVRSDGTRAVLL